METKITNKTENKLLKRTEIEGTLAFQGATPSNKELAAELAKQLKTQEELIEIKKIDTKFGTMTASFKAHIYADKDTLMKTEPKKKVEEKKEEGAE